MGIEQIRSLPFAVAVAALFVIVLCRSNATYWLGRGIAAGVTGNTSLGRRIAKSRLARRWDPSRLDRARRLIDRWGPFAVILTFLTIGLQTAVNLAAGATRMRLLYYLPATIIGSAAWAFLYATVGLAAFELWVEHAAASPWAWALIGAVLLTVMVRVLLLQRRGRAESDARVGGSGEDRTSEQRSRG